MAEIGDIVRGNLITDDGANQMGANVLWYQVTSKSGTGATDFELATALDLAAAAPYKALLANVARYRGASMQRVLPLPSFAAQFTVASAGFGTAGAEMLPRQTCGIISWRTGFAGRALRGRSYIAFPSETDNGSTAVPTAGYLTRLSTLAGAIRTLLAGSAGNLNGLTLGIFHRVNQTITNTTNSTLLQARWGTQRRRSSFGQQNIPPF